MTLTTGREVFSRISTIILLFIYSFFSWLGWTIILKAYLPYLQRHRAPTGATSLYQCLDKWTQRLRPPSNPLSSPSSRTTSLQDLSFQDQLMLFFVVKSSFANQPWAVRSARIIPPKWKPPSTVWSTCKCRHPTPTSLCFHFHHEDVVLGGVNHLWATTWSTSRGLPAPEQTGQKAHLQARQGAFQAQWPSSFQSPLPGVD